MKMLSACLLLLPFISCTQVQDTKNDAVIEQKIETLLSKYDIGGKDRADEPDFFLWQHRGYERIDKER